MKLRLRLSQKSCKYTHSNICVGRSQGGQGAVAEKKRGAGVTYFSQVSS